jgi:hypothetical protein
MQHRFASEWKKAAEMELNRLEEMGTWSEVRKPHHKRTIPLMWVFTYKFDEAGYLKRFKARVVARGDLRPVTREDNYAATLTSKTFRVVCALIASADLEAEQWDVVSAFLNSPIPDDQEIYVGFPDGFMNQGCALRLHRALYGLRQSPKLWFNTLSRIFDGMGLTRADEEVCLFMDERLVAGVLSC